MIILPLVSFLTCLPTHPKIVSNKQKMWNRKIKYVLENRQFLSLLFDQDSANCNGGKWIIRFKKAISGRFWEDLVSEAQLNSFLSFYYSFLYLFLFALAILVFCSDHWQDIFMTDFKVSTNYLCFPNCNSFEFYLFRLCWLVFQDFFFFCSNIRTITESMLKSWFIVACWGTYTSLISF